MPHNVLLIFLTVIAVISSILSVGILIGKNSERNKVYQEAIIAGSAVWIPDADGKPSIKWVTLTK